MGQPLALQAAGKAGPVVLFARNRLCALVRPDLDVTSETLLSAMLDPAVRLGTAPPKADPSGDYAWEVSVVPRRFSQAAASGWTPRP